MRQRDIYQSSKYYKQAHSDPNSISPPLGYQFLHSQHVVKPISIKKESKITNKYPIEKSLSKLISARGTPSRDLGRFLVVSQVQRKNQYMSGSNSDFMNNKLGSMLGQLRRCYFPSWQGQDSDWLELLGGLSTLGDNLFSIRDYSLSTYFVYYTGQTTKFYQHMQKQLEEQFLEYNTQILINSDKLSRPQLRKIDINSLEETQAYIRQINSIGSQKDKHFNGIHLFISDWLPSSSALDPSSEQAQVWPWLQFNLTVLTSILGQGQHAVLKVRGTFTHKTTQFIFLLKLAFSKVHFHKNILSNPFTNDKFIVCEYFNKENGKIIAQHLNNHYGMLAKEKDNKLLVDPKTMFSQDFQLNITNFNDISPILKLSKEHIKELQGHTNLILYPNKEKLQSKLQQLKLSQQQIKQVLQLIPDPEDVPVTGKEQQFVQKKAAEIDFNSLVLASTKKKEEFEYKDLSHKRQTVEDQYLHNYIKQGEVIMQQRKNNKKSKSKKKEQED